MKRTWHLAMPLAWALLAAGLLAGCASSGQIGAKPWERGTLASYEMNPARDPLGAGMAEHVYASREGSAGGGPVGGAGCGCN
jgi:hypothetical protein